MVRKRRSNVSIKKSNKKGAPSVPQTDLVGTYARRVTRSSLKRENVNFVHGQLNDQTNIGDAIADGGIIEKGESIDNKYAFADSETKEIFMQIRKSTSNEDLASVYNEQKRRASSKKAPLKLYEVIRNNSKTKANKEGTHMLTLIMREMTTEEPTPPHANTERIQKVKQMKITTRIIEPLDFTSPGISTLRNTYNALSNLLGKDDCESYHSVEIANSYYEYWKPIKPKVILIAESHVSTPLSYSLHGPAFDTNLLGRKIDEYRDGPVKFCSLVYCLSYGEPDSLKVYNTTTTNQCTTIDHNQDTALCEIPRKQNTGTYQFWNLFSACISSIEDDPTQYGNDLLKSSSLTPIQRIKRKLDILNKMKSRGIWLLDTSIIGWYITQPTSYDIAKKSKQVTKLPSSRPHPKLKKPCLQISWEGHVKHVVREAATGKDSALKLVIPIGKDVESALGKQRFLDAVKGSDARVVDAFPAPNARVPGGYTKIYEKIARLVRDATT